MTLFTQSQRDLLLANGSPENREKDHKPVVMLYMNDAPCVWLLTEIDPEQPELAFGLCDLGLGYPELGYVSLDELATVHGRLGLPVCSNDLFEARYPISVYAQAASYQLEITWNPRILDRVARELSREGKLTPPTP